MTLGELLQRARRALASQGIAEADLEAEVLLRHVLGLDRARFYASLNSEVTPPHGAAFWDLLQRRLRREPLAYILGYKEFYGLTFKVNPHVLIPRPESELLVDKALEVACSRPAGLPFSVADVGTGSGAIAIALACNLPPGVIVYATDISSKALEVARENALHYGVGDRVRFLEGDLLKPLPEAVDLMVANLPYVTTDNLSRSMPELLFEPRQALDGGHHGVDVLGRLVAQAPGYLKEGGALILEIDPPQLGAIREMAQRAFPRARVSVARDLAGLERVLMVRL